MKNKNIPNAKQTNYEDWFASLQLDKQMYVAQHVKKRIDKIQDETEMILDSCYIAAMIELFDMNLSDCIEIAKKANENMDETLNILNKEGEKYYMKVNNNVLREEIKVEVKALIIENTKINNLEIIKLLQKDYDLARKDLQILIKEAREELANEALKELEKEINVKEVDEEKEIKVEVFKNGEKVNLENVPVHNYATGELKATLMHEGEHGFEITQDKVSIKLNDGFKINKIELEKNGRIYIKDSEGVKIGDKIYKDIADLEEEKKAYFRRTEGKEKELKDTIEKLNTELQERVNKKFEEAEKYAEIEQIFAM